VQELAPAQVIGVGLDVVGRRLGDGLALLRQQLDLQLLHDRVRDLVLDCEDVGEVAIEAVGPDVPAVLAVDQLAGDPDPPAGLADAALEDVPDAEFLADLLHPDRLALVGECGVAGDDEQPRDLRQVGDDVLGDSVAEVLLLRVAAHVVEGQHDDGGPLCRRGGHALRGRRRRTEHLLQRGDEARDVRIEGLREGVEPVRAAEAVLHRTGGHDLLHAKRKDDLVRRHGALDLAADVRRCVGAGGKDHDEGPGGLDRVDDLLAILRARQNVSGGDPAADPRALESGEDGLRGGLVRGGVAQEDIVGHERVRVGICGVVGIRPVGT